MSFKRKELGKLGEDKAEEKLLEEGYEILGRNYRNKIGEIDIVAKENGVYCFVEVKAKTGLGYGSPEEMVDKRKQIKVAKTSRYYLLENDLEDESWRIDVVAYDSLFDEIRLIKNAVEINLL